ncbi:hypothetical protein [Marinicella sp. W31]|uniref:hypothetical protein n=1 Tax=Marinicella sp. W31 TaxID=3023713 RepID=UPI0037573093
MLYKKVIFLLIVTNPIFALDIDLGADLEIPAICENIPEFALAVDLSPACLSAQLAAEAFPPLLPAANRLCQILEGTTAIQGVIQIEVNTIHEQCQLAFSQMQRDMFEGDYDYSQILNDILDRRRRVANSTNDIELLENAISQEQVGFISHEDWKDILAHGNKGDYARLSLVDEVAKTKFLSKFNLDNGNAQGQIERVKALIDMAGSDIEIKGSQDINSRLMGELSYQQQVFQQLLNQYIALLAAQEQERLAGQEFWTNFIGGNDE